MKEVPYFPLYAANIMASRPYKLMSLGERGLWITITMECWVNGGVPSDHAEMGKILGFSKTEIENFFSTYQTAFFEKANGQFVSKELNEYRVGYEERREKQRLGGKKGAERKKEKQVKGVEAKNLVQGQPQGQPIGSLSYLNSNSVTSNQLINKEVLAQSNDEWLSAMENAPEANDYRDQSQGL